MILPDIQHLFITKTRKELNFPYEPIDKLHYIELDQSTKDIYNELLKDKMYEWHSHQKECILLCDSPMKLRASLHMLEGGDYCGIVPKSVIPKYCHSCFPEEDKIIDFVNPWHDKEIIEVIEKYATWYPLDKLELLKF